MQCINDMTTEYTYFTIPLPRIRPMATPATGLNRGTPASSIARLQLHTVAILKRRHLIEAAAAEEVKQS